MSELGQNLLTWVIIWLASSVFKYYCLPSLKLFSNAVGLSYIGDYIIIVINYASECIELVVTNLINSIIENRLNLLLLYILFYAGTVGTIAWESKSLGDFYQKMQVKKNEACAVILGKRTLFESEEQNPNGEKFNKLTEHDKTKEVEGVKKADSSSSPPICWSCLECAKPLLRCVGCMKARYCGEECQREDWGRHGEWCRRRGCRREENRRRKISGNIDVSGEVD